MCIWRSRPKASMLYRSKNSGCRMANHLDYAACKRSTRRGGGTPPHSRARIAGIELKTTGTYNSGGISAGCHENDTIPYTRRRAASASLQAPHSGRRMLLPRPAAAAKHISTACARGLRGRSTSCGSYVKRPAIRLGACLAGRRPRCCGQTSSPCTAATAFDRTQRRSHAPHPGQGRSRAAGREGVSSAR